MRVRSGMAAGGGGRRRPFNPLMRRTRLAHEARPCRNRHRLAEYAVKQCTGDDAHEGALDRTALGKSRNAFGAWTFTGHRRCADAPPSLGRIRGHALSRVGRLLLAHIQGQRYIAQFAFEERAHSCECRAILPNSCRRSRNHLVLAESGSNFAEMRPTPVELGVEFEPTLGTISANGPIRPGINQIRADCDRIRAANQPGIARSWPDICPESNRMVPDSAKFAPKSAKVGPNSTKSGLTSVKFDQHRAGFGHRPGRGIDQHRVGIDPEWPRLRSTLARPRQTSADIGGARPALARTRPSLAPTRPKFVRRRPNLGRPRRRSDEHVWNAYQTA